MSNNTRLARGVVHPIKEVGVIAEGLHAGAPLEEIEVTSDADGEVEIATTEKDASLASSTTEGSDTNVGNKDDGEDSGDVDLVKKSVDETEASDSDGENKIVQGKEKNPWSLPFCGIPINYFSVGVIYGGSVSVLYPLLIVQHGVTASFYAASSSLVTLFWSYKIFFGILSDCFPVRGQKWKPYIVVGWAMCAIMLAVLASMGPNVSPINLVIMLTFANLGYVAADVAADGFMVWMAHHESEKRRGKIQSLIYIMRSIGRIFINLVIIFAFSGPSVNCPGYQEDRNVPCTTDEAVTARNHLFADYADSDKELLWCYDKCDDADFAFGMTVSCCSFVLCCAMLFQFSTCTVYGTRN